MTACLSPLSPLKDDRYNDALLPAKSSPLKRSDGIMNLDQANLGSPVAKRRSIYGSFAHSFNIFEDQTAARLFEVNHDVKPTDSPCKSRGSPSRRPWRRGCHCENRRCSSVIATDRACPRPDSVRIISRTTAC